MPVNRNALIRYRTIDNCLQNRYRKWTLDDLIEEVSETLYDYEGIEKGVSKRTVQMDIQMMRSDKLGYNAPIIVIDKKYYTYEDPEYSITNIPLTDQDLNKLSETVDFLKQFRGFSHFKELESMVQKLEDHIYARKTQQKSVIDFEKNENLRGLKYLDPLYQAIIKREELSLTYQSFKARQPSTFNFQPHLLKEFKNRWFIIGIKRKREGFLNLALDRILDIKRSGELFVPSKDFDSEAYFKDVIGVSVSPEMEPEEVLLYVINKHAPYVETKPFHWSQKVISHDPYGITISIRVQHNFELEKEILGFGDGIKVIAPTRLKRNIKERLAGALELYNTEISEKGLETAKKKLYHKGTAMLNHIYSTKEIRLMRQLIADYFSKQPVEDTPFSLREVLKKIPKLKNVVFNRNLKRVLSSVDSNAFLVKSVFFNKPLQSNWYVTWHQDIPINVTEKKEVDGFYGWTNKAGVTSVCPPAEINRNCFTLRIHLDDTSDKNGALKVLPGSHQKRLSDEEIKLITSNSIPQVCEVYSGGVHMIRPLILHASAKTASHRQRRVIHLEFSSEELPEGLEWAERESF